MSEYGCNVPSPRKFGEVTTLYSDKMSPVFSGGLVYEYSQEDNNYGLVQISDDRGSVKKLGDFDALKKQFGAAKDPGSGGYQEGLDIAECPEFVGGVWEANNTLPALPSDAQKYYVRLRISMAS